MSAALATAIKSAAAPQAAPPALLQQPLQPSAFALAPLASLCAIPAMPNVQRKCAACEEEESKVQPRLEVGPVGDRYEVEADTIAAQVMAMRDPGSEAGAATASGETVQRACSACSSSKDEPRARRLSGDPVEEELKVRASRAGGPETIAASDNELTCGGEPLPSGTRSYFEGRMGRDLSDVRVHQGSAASAMNESISARAFTYKNHVWLGAAETAGPSFTMAHELAHVMQQTAPGPVGPAARRSTEQVEASTASGTVQRKENAFWLPVGTISAKGLHESMHNAALDEIRKVNPSVLTEVPIPGANRRYVDVGARGRADIYTATANPTVMVPGVQQVALPQATIDPNPAPANDPGASAAPVAAPTVPAKASMAELDNFTPGMLDGAMEQGASAVSHENRRAPKIDAGRLTDMASAPQGILIGEMKPAHDTDYRKSGADQIANYIAGITAVANKVNAVAAVTGNNSSWHPNAKVIGGGASGVTIPPGWDASAPHSDWKINSLMIRHYTPTRQQLKTGNAKTKPKAQNAKQGRPKSQPIRGRWMMAPDNMAGHEGVFVYFLAPNPDDLKKALKPSSTRKEFRGLVKKVEKIKHDLIVAPKASPVGSGKAQPRRLPRPVPQSVTASAAAPKVARKDAPEKAVKDTFKAATWEAERTGAGIASGATDDSLLAGYTAAADNDLRDEIAEQGAMAEWLDTKPPTTGTRYDTAAQQKAALDDLSLIKKVDFWTSIKAKPLGILREKFGLFFVKAYEKVVGLGKAVREKFKSFGESKILAGKTGTIVKAAAKVAAVILPRLAKPFLAKMFDTIINCGITGFEQKFRELTQDTIIDDIIQTVEQMKEKVEQIKEDVEAFFKDIVEKTFGPIATEFKEFVESAKLVMDVVSLVKDITQAIRIGSCVAGLAAAPETVGIGAVVGCGAALGDFILSKFGLSPVDHLIGTILSSCEMQNKLGTLMAGISFVKTLPQRAGGAIVKEVKSLLANSETLQQLGSFQNKTYAQHASELFCNPDAMAFPELGYEKTDCSDTGGYARSKTGSYDIPKSVPLYQKQDPEPAAEQPWKGVEIPPGRSGEQATKPEKPKTTEPQAPVPPPDPPVIKIENLGPPATGKQPGSSGQSVEPADSVREGNLTKAKPSKVVLEIHGGFDPAKRYDGSQMSGAHVMGTDSDGNVYGPLPVTIYIISIVKNDKGWTINYRFKTAKPTDNIILTDGKTGVSIEIYDSATGTFSSPIRGQIPGGAKQ